MYQGFMHFVAKVLTTVTRHTLETACFDDEMYHFGITKVVSTFSSILQQTYNHPMKWCNPTATDVSSSDSENIAFLPRIWINERH